MTIEYKDVRVKASTSYKQGIVDVPLKSSLKSRIFKDVPVKATFQDSGSVDVPVKAGVEVGRTDYGLYGVSEWESQPRSTFFYAQDSDTPNKSASRHDPYWITKGASSEGGTDGVFEVGIGQSDDKIVDGTDDANITSFFRGTEDYWKIKPALWFRPQSAAPATNEGTLYYDSDDARLRYYDGSRWRFVGAGAEGYADNFGVTTGLSISDDGGLDISWTAGTIYDLGSGTIIDIDAGSGTCTDDAANYLKWVSGGTLTLSTTEPTGEQILVGYILCEDGDIWDLKEAFKLSGRESYLVRAVKRMFPSIITQGLLVYEDDDATNTWDVLRDSGEFYHRGLEEVELSSLYTRNTPMIRWYHSGGEWVSDTNAEIDTNNWDNGTNLEAVRENKYYKSMFFIGDEHLHWVYPQEEFNTVAQAISNGLPSMPPGLESLPRSTALVLRGNATAFPDATSDQWIDIRPFVGGGGFVSGGGTVSDHGYLSGLSDDDHTQYLLVDGTRSMSGGLDMGGNTISNTGDVTVGGDLTASAINVGCNAIGRDVEVVDDILVRTSASAGGDALLIHADTNGGTLWANTNYDPASPGTGWAKVLTLDSNQLATFEDDVTVGGDLTASGTLGVNIASPAKQMEVVSSDFEVARFTRGAAGGGSAIELENANGNIVTLCNAATDYFFIKTPSNSPAFKVADNTDVTVYGDLTISGNDILDSGGNTIFSFDGSGNIDSITRIDSDLHINSNTDSNALIVSRGTSSEVETLTVSVDDRNAYFRYTEDNSESSAGAIKFTSRRDDGAGGYVDVNTVTLIDTDGTSTFPQDMSINGGLTLSDSLNMSSNPITNITTPSSGSDAATKDYVDSKVLGLDWKESVLDKDLATPPGSPVEGDRYIIASGGTDAWSGHDNEITEWNGSSWEFIVPNEGAAVWVEDEDVIYNYNGSSWVKFGTIADHGNLIGLGDKEDHTWALTLDGTRTMTGSLDMGTNAITNVGNVDGVDVSTLKSDVDGFPDELKNLITTEIQQIENIDSVTITNTQWGYLGSLDQSLATTDSPSFSGLTVSGGIIDCGYVDIDGSSGGVAVKIWDRDGDGDSYSQMYLDKAGGYTLRIATKVDGSWASKPVYLYDSSDYQPAIYDNFPDSVNLGDNLVVSGYIQGASGGGDNAFKVGDDCWIKDIDTANAIGIQGDQDATQGIIVFGSGEDTNLYRSTANTLKTDDSFVIGGDFTVSGTLAADLDIGKYDLEKTGRILFDDDTNYLIEVTSTGDDGGTMYDIGVVWDTDGTGPYSSENSLFVSGWETVGLGVGNGTDVVLSSTSSAMTIAPDLTLNSDLDVDGGDIEIANNFEISYNSTSESLDFNYIG